LVQSGSNHPIAKAIVNYYQKPVKKESIKNIQEIPGQGIRAEIIQNNQTQIVLVGNKRLIKNANKINQEQTAVHISINEKYVGSITLKDKLKTDSHKTIKALKLKKIMPVMLTGDNKKAAKEIAKKLQIDKIYAELLPQDKVKIIEKLLSKKSKNQTLAFVGDGINDAPVLARADVGIAMGSLGSDAAIEAADIVIMTDEPYKIIEAINISKRTFFIAKQNAIFATGVKFFVLIFGAFGAISMWTAIFADVGVTILAILNAFRANKKSF